MNLTRYLKSKRVKQIEIAEKAGYASSTVSDVVNGKREPTAKFMRAIASATDYKVMPNDLVYPDGVPKK